MRLSAVSRASRGPFRHTSRAVAALAPLLALAGAGCFPEPGDLQARPGVSEPMADAAVTVADTQLAATDTQLARDEGFVEPPPTGPNNTAELAKGDVGTKASPVASVRKQLGVNLLAALPEGLVLGQAYGTHLFATGKNLDTIIPVTNNGTKLWCGVHTARVIYKDAGGAMVFTSSDMNPVNGTVAAVGTLWTSTCLGPGETGYFLDIQNYQADTMIDLYASTASLDVEIKIVTTGQALDARVLPVAYQYQPGKFTLQVKNVGARAARLKKYSSFIVFDAEGPVAWELLSPVLPDQVLVASDTAVLQNVRSITTASGGRVRAMISFDDPSTPVSTAVAGDVPPALRTLDAFVQARAQRLLHLR
jgi:hypothetical protein